MSVLNHIRWLSNVQLQRSTNDLPSVQKKMYAVRAALHAPRLARARVVTSKQTRDVKFTLPLNQSFSVRSLSSRVPSAYTTTFMLPEQGMAHHETLSRASLTMVKNNENKIVCLAPAHVSHPWLYRGKFYPGNAHEWLQFVHEQAVLSRFGVFTDSGELLLDLPLARGGARSEKYDCVAQVFADSEKLVCENYAAAVQQLLGVSASASLPIFELEDDAIVLAEGEPVLMVGHALRHADHHDNELMLPHLLEGVISYAEHERGLVQTAVPAEMGMCGGPVISLRTGKCLGIVEALITGTPEGRPELRDNTLFLRSPVLRPLLSRAVSSDGSWNVV